MSLADTAKLLYFASIIIWLLPAIRHHKSFMFDFFLVLAFIDPIALTYGLITKTSIPLWLTALFAYLLIISITTEELLKKLKYVFITLPLIFIVLIPFLLTQYYHVIIIAENLVLLLVFLKWLITYYVANKKLKIFYVMLVFYVLTVILKIFNLLIGFADAIAFFYITSIAQIIFGLFFSIAREDESGFDH